MRSSRVSKRALRQVEREEGTWPHSQGVDEADLPHNKSTQPAKPEASKDASVAITADWMGDLIRNTIQWISSHRNDTHLKERVKELPIASKVGPNALEGPVEKFISTGNTSELSSDLEALMSHRRTTASLEDLHTAAPDTEVTVSDPGKVDRVIGSIMNNYVGRTVTGKDLNYLLSQTGLTPDEIYARLQEKGVQVEPGQDLQSTKFTFPSAEQPVTSSVVDEDYPMDDEDMDDEVECPECGGPGVPLGNLGSQRHYRCRNCGMDFSHKTASASASLYTPKTAAEIDVILEASGAWVRQAACSGVMQGKPSFVLGAKRALAVVSPQGDVLGKNGLTSRYASLVSKTASERSEIENKIRKLRQQVFEVPDDSPEQQAITKQIEKLKAQMAKLPSDQEYKGALDPDPRVRNRGLSIASLASKQASGGAEDDHPEDETETTVDSSVVSLLEACKREWTNLGDPVNPDTWPKEIERAILALNDKIVDAIQKTEDELADGEFYSKNVDEGVDREPSEGAGLLSGLNVDESDSPEEVEPKMTTASRKRGGLHPALEPENIKCVHCGRPYGQAIHNSRGALCPRCGKPMMRPNKFWQQKLIEEWDAEHAMDNQHKAQLVEKHADVTPTDTRRALKHVQSLKGDIADQFFQFKKIVEAANDASVIRAIAEDMVTLKAKVEEAEKVLTKQLSVLEEAEEVAKAKETATKKESSAKQANQYIKKCPGHKDSEGHLAEWCVTDKAGKTISSHTTQEKAEESFAAMERSKNSSAKKADCPTCGAPSTNTANCPSCQAQEQNPANQQPNTQPQAVKPQPVQPQTPVSPVKQYGSIMAGLNLE